MLDFSKLPAQAIDLLRRIGSGDYCRERLFDELTLDWLRWRALPCPPLMPTGRALPWLTYCEELGLLTPEGGLTPLGLAALELAGTKSPRSDAEGEQMMELPTIWYHDEQSYSTDGRNPKVVSREQHYVLQAFLDRD